MTPASQRKAAERERNKAAGLIRKDVWVRPSVWERVKAFVKKRNEEAEKEAR